MAVWKSFNSWLTLQLWPYFGRNKELLASLYCVVEGNSAGYSWDLKWRMVCSCLYRNMSCKEAAETFCTSEGTAKVRSKFWVELRIKWHSWQPLSNSCTVPHPLTGTSWKWPPCYCGHIVAVPIEILLAPIHWHPPKYRNLYIPNTSHT